jgi:hypothetical protein
MEISQGKSLCSYLKQTKMSFFFLLQEGRIDPARGDSYQWEGDDGGKGHGRVNMVQILCTHVWNWKNETC